MPVIGFLDSGSPAVMLWKPLVIVVPSAAIVLAVLYIVYRFIDPIPPGHFAIAAGMAGSGYDNFARQYARILARDGVELEVRNVAGAVDDLNLLRDGASGVQAALTALGFTQPRDADTLYSLGGVFDAPIFIFHRNAEPITQFAQFRGKRLSIGTPGTALRGLMLQVLTVTDAVVRPFEVDLRGLRFICAWFKIEWEPIAFDNSSLRWLEISA